MKQKENAEVCKVQGPSCFLPPEEMTEGAEGDILKQRQQCELLKSGGIIRSNISVHIEASQWAVACQRCDCRRIQLRQSKRGQDLAPLWQAANTLSGIRLCNSL